MKMSDIDFVCEVSRRVRDYNPILYRRVQKMKVQITKEGFMDKVPCLMYEIVIEYSNDPVLKTYAKMWLNQKMN